MSVTFDVPWKANGAAASLPRSVPGSAASSMRELHAMEYLESEDEGGLGEFSFSWKRLLLHVGPGALVCIAYIDPGNLESDLQAGAHTGYSLLWVLFWSTAMGYLLQALAGKLGVATGRHLAEQCRAYYPPAVRNILWAMAELAIIGSDIQEVIGTAIALRLLSAGTLPLWVGVVVAAATAYGLLFLERWGIRYLEHFFQLLVAVMSISFGYMFFSAGIPYHEVARGMLVPQLSRESVSVACGILGAVIMPHNLFLHSALVHSRQVYSGRPARKAESILYYSIEAALALAVTLFINTFVISVFAKGFHGKAASEDIGLENAGQYLGSVFGPQMTLIWAVGLLAAGQSSTMTGTYAGQFVMTGFLNLKMSAFLRTLLTRAVAVCPTLAVALAYRHDTTKMDDFNQWLNVLQSVQLPFAVIPLLVLTSDVRVMGRRFRNGLLMAAACWVIAAAIIAINASVAYQAAVLHLPEDTWVHGLFWSAVVCYLLFLLYLVLTPERVARWLCWLTGGRLGGEGGAEPGALGYSAGAAVASPRWAKPPVGAFGAVAAAGGEGWEAAEGGVGEEEEEQLEEASVGGGRVVGEVVATYTVRRGKVTRVGRSLSDTLPPSVLGQPLSPRFGGEDGLGSMRPGSADSAAGGDSGRGGQAAVPGGQPGSELQQPLLEAGPSGS